MPGVQGAAHSSSALFRRRAQGGGLSLTPAQEEPVADLSPGELRLMAEVLLAMRRSEMPPLPLLVRAWRRVEELTK